MERPGLLAKIGAKRRQVATFTKRRLTGADQSVALTIGDQCSLQISDNSQGPRKSARWDVSSQPFR